MLRHLQDRVHRLLLGSVNERTGIDHDDVSVFGTGCNFCPARREQAHHDLAVHQVLGTAQAHKPYFLGGSSGSAPAASIVLNLRRTCAG